MRTTSCCSPVRKLVAKLQSLWAVEIGTLGFQHRKCGFCKINKFSMKRCQKELEGVWLSMGKDGIFVCEVFKRDIWLGGLGKEA